MLCTLHDSYELSRCSSGFFAYRFTTPGVYYYSSGYVDNGNSRSLQGVVKVEARAERRSEVSVSVGGMEARHVTGGKHVDVVKIHMNYLHCDLFVGDAAGRRCMLWLVLLSHSYTNAPNET